MTPATFLATFKHHLNVGGPQRDEIIAEMESHLKEESAEKLGDPKVLAKKYNYLYFGRVGSSRFFWQLPWIITPLYLTFGTTQYYFGTWALWKDLVNNLSYILINMLYLLIPFWIGWCAAHSQEPQKRMLELIRSVFLSAIIWKVILALPLPWIFHMDGAILTVDLGIVASIAIFAGWSGFTIVRSTSWKASWSLTRTFLHLELCIAWMAVWFFLFIFWQALFGLSYLLPITGPLATVISYLQNLWVGAVITGSIVWSIGIPRIHHTLRSIDQPISPKKT